MRNRVLIVMGLLALMAVVLLGCTMSRGGSARITPTPTKTPKPLFTATMTSSPTPAPTDTPLPTATPVPPTDTPPPTETPLPTATAVPPTEVVPTDTPVPPTATDAPPTATSQPQAINTPAPPTNTPKPAVDFRVADLFAFVDGSTGASGLHNVYFTVLDAGGAPIDGVIIEEFNNDPHTQTISGDKGPGKAEFVMWAANYRFRVVGNTGGQTLSSEETHVLSIVFGQATWDDLIRGGVCTTVEECQAMGQSHYSYQVTFQRTW